MPKRRVPKPKSSRSLTPAGFRRLIAEELECVNSRPNTAWESQHQLRAYYRISRIVNRHLGGRAAYGEHQFAAMAEAVGHRYVWLYELRFFSQRYAAPELKELCSYDPPLCWGHVRLLLPVRDRRRRRKLQRLAVERGWSTERLRHEIRFRVGPGRHRGRGMQGLDSPETCLHKLTQLANKWTRFAQAAVDRAGGPLMGDELSGGTAEHRKRLAQTVEALEHLNSASRALRQRLKRLAPRE